MKSVRLNVDLRPLLYRRLKAVLALRGLSIAQWVRGQVERLVEKEEK